MADNEWRVLGDREKLSGLAVQSNVSVKYHQVTCQLWGCRMPFMAPVSDKGRGTLCQGKAVILVLDFS